MKLLHDIIGVIIDLLNIAISRAESLSCIKDKSQFYIEIGGELYNIYKALKYIYYETEERFRRTKGESMYFNIEDALKQGEIEFMFTKRRPR